MIKNTIVQGAIMAEGLQLFNKTQANQLLVQSFIHSENRKQSDERIITDVKKILEDVKKKIAV